MSLNVIVIQGRLVRDPEYRTTGSGISVANFSIAVDRDFGNKDGGEKETDFIDCTAWRKTAEFVTKYFTKGRMIVVSGRLQTSSYTDKQGNKRKTVEVVAEEVHFAEPKRDSQPRNEMPHGGFDPMAGLGGNAFAALPGDDNDLPF